MTNKDFYAFCRDNRKTERDPHKRETLADVYNYMRECGVTKRRVHWYCAERGRQETLPERKIAYQWLRGVFAGTTPDAIADMPAQLW